MSIRTVGISIQKDKVTYISLLVNRKGPFEIETCGEVALDQLPFSKDDVAVYRHAVLWIINKYNLKSSHVVVSLPENYLLLRTIEIPTIERERIDALIPHEAKKYFPKEESKISWDYEIVDQDRVNQNSWVIIYIQDSLPVDPFNQVQNDYFVKSLQGIDVVPSVLSRVARWMYDMNRRVIFYWGQETSFVILMMGEGWSCQSIPIGYGKVYRQIAKEYSLSVAEVEETITKSNVAIDQGLSREVVFFQAKVKEQLKQVQEKINQYTKRVKPVVFDDFYIAGPSLDQPGLKVLFAKSLPYNIDIMNVMTQSECKKSGQISEKESKEGYKYSIALGCALAGVSKDFIFGRRVNLLSKEYQEYRVSIKNRYWWWVVIGVWLGSIALGVFGALKIGGKYQQVKHYLEREMLIEKRRYQEQVQVQKEVQKILDQETKMFWYRNSINQKVQILIALCQAFIPNLVIIKIEMMPTEKVKSNFKKRYNKDVLEAQSDEIIIEMSGKVSYRKIEALRKACCNHYLIQESEVIEARDNEGGEGITFKLKMKVNEEQQTA